MTSRLKPRTDRRADRSAAVVDADELTPVQWHSSIAYKRDDLYLPFADVDLNGGKVRQAIKLVEANLPAIRKRYGSTLLTATGVHSPQGLIIARVAALFDLSCVLFIGATSVARALTGHPMLRAAVQLGATLDASARVAYEPALAKAVDSWRSAHSGAGFPIRFGMNLDSDPAAIVGSTAAQCANIPDDIHTVVIPVGAGITAAGIITGCRTLRPAVQRIVCVQIAGYDRRPVIDRITPYRDYEFMSSRAYQYATHVRRYVAPRFPLDPIYEAKAHEYMIRRIPIEREHTLFWVVGDSGYVRD